MIHNLFVFIQVVTPKATRWQLSAIKGSTIPFRIFLVKRSTKKKKWKIKLQNDSAWLNCTCRLFWHRWQRLAAFSLAWWKSATEKGQMHVSNCLSVNKHENRNLARGWGLFLTLPAPRENRSQSLLSGPPANISRPATSAHGRTPACLNLLPGRTKLFNPMKVTQVFTLVLVLSFLLEVGYWKAMIAIVNF